MILDFQLNTCCFAAYKPYRMLEMVIALLNDELMMHLYIYYVHDFNIKNKGILLLWEKSIPALAGNYNFFKH